MRVSKSVFIAPELELNKIQSLNFPCATMRANFRGRGRTLEKGTLEQTPRLFDNKGSLDQMPLSVLLQSMQSQRATGTLQVRKGSETFALFFLFGHLFHAYGDGTQGEEAVFTPLAWRQGDYAFDPKSKLPAEETIKASTADILAEAKRRGLPGAESVGPAPAAAGPANVEPAVAEQAPVAPAAAAPAPAGLAAAGAEPVPATELYPLPVGRLVYESLKTAFVDFPKLLRSLSADHLTGYLRLSGLSSRGMILFYKGSLIESFYDGGAVVSTGRTAFSLFKNDVDRGEGTMDVIDLSPEVVTAIYQLLTAPTILQGLMARFVNVKALLEYLQEEQIHGSLLVRAPEEMGIVLLRGGQLLGAFTRTQPQLVAEAEVVLRLCNDPKTRIEVKAVADLEDPASVSLEEMLSSAAPVPATAFQVRPSAAPGLTSQTYAGAVRTAYSPTPVGPPTPSSQEPEPNVDWDGLLRQLFQMADAALQNRSKKVKEMLAATEHSLDALDRTIDRIAQISIMFVPPERLTNLADQMRQVVEAER